jgi:glycosyltransferase involved in cell wall biosynthesis
MDDPEAAAPSPIASVSLMSTRLARQFTRRRSEPQPRVAVVHDYLSQRGGAERVTLSLMKAFPNARLITSVYEPDLTFPEFGQYDIETTWLNKVPAFRRDPRRALPLLASAFSRYEVEGVDIVVCSSSGWAHGIKAPGIPKLVYCHSPARWLYESADYFAGKPSYVIKAARPGLAPLRRWDRRAARSVDHYLVTSSTVQTRLMRAYGRSAPIVHPPTNLGGGDGEPVPGIEPGFLLVVSRRRGYKHVSIVCEAVEKMPGERLVVVGGLPDRDDPWCDRAIGLMDLTDEQLRWMYANCKALVATSYEDFGLTPIEAYSSGRPAIVLRRGGYLDSTIEGVTGIFVEEPTCAAVMGAVRQLGETAFDSEAIMRHSVQFSESAFITRMREEAQQLLISSARHIPGMQPSAENEPGQRAYAS